MTKSRRLAFLLAFIPGLGHFYWNRPLRAVLYGGAFFGTLFFLFLLTIANTPVPKGPGMFLVFIAFLAWLINMIDMIVSLLAYQPQSQRLAGGNTDEAQASGVLMIADQQTKERFYTILLSIIPGLGHFQLGLMQRGLTLLIGFFGLFTMIVFVTYVTRENSFLVFLFALPAVVLYGLFDAVQLLNSKQRGEELVDRTIFEDLEQGKASGRKSKIVAMCLSIFPGAGHMYLGLQRRGLQLMAAFLFSIYIMDVLRLTIFLFLIPLVWFFCLFDAMQYATKQGEEPLEDIPLVNWLMNHQKWIGIGLLALGSYYLIDRALLSLLDRLLPDVRISFWFHNYFQIFIVSTLMISGGLKLIWSSKGSKRGSHE